MISLVPVVNIRPAPRRILDVQCALAKSSGVDITVQDLGKPRGYGEDEEGMAIGKMGGGGGGGAPREPMQDLVQSSGTESQAAYEANAAQAAAIRSRNMGSNIFG